MLSREAAIQEIFNKHGESSVYVTNTGYISRAVHTLFPNNKNIFYILLHFLKNIFFITKDYLI